MKLYVTTRKDSCGSGGFTPYNYAFNNPLRFIDPDGMQAVDAVGDNDDWYRKANGEIVYDENIKGYGSFLNRGLDLDGAEYIGAMGSETDVNGNILRLFENGGFQVNGTIYNYDEWSKSGSVSVESFNITEEKSSNITPFLSKLADPYLKVGSFIVNATISEVNVIKENGTIPSGNQIYQKGFSKPYFYGLSNFKLRKIDMGNYDSKDFGLDIISVTPLKLSIFKNNILNIGASAGVKTGIKKGVEEID